MHRVMQCNVDMNAKTCEKNNSVCVYMWVIG